MEPKIGEFLAELEAYDVQKLSSKTLELYEEYSQKPIADTIKIRKESFERADFKAKDELLEEAELEVKDFRTWLEETKNLESTIAYYYSVSIKSLLIGLPFGVRMAQLFESVLNIQAGK